jgi:CxxC-x17-CxxC domain-containing protein
MSAGDIMPPASGRQRLTSATRPAVTGQTPEEDPTLALKDKTLNCRDCGEQFVFTAGEQGFYLEKGLLNDPQRCPECRLAKRRERAEQRRDMSTIVCASCGSYASVPFVPRLDRPVYCNSCFEQARSSPAQA